MISTKTYDGNELKCGTFYDDSYTNIKDKNNDTNDDDDIITTNTMVMIRLFMLREIV